MNVGFFYDNKEFLVSCAVAIACTGLFLFFPTVGIVDTLISSVMFLIGIPLLYIKIVLRKDFATFGLQKGVLDRKAWTVIAIAAFAFAIVAASLLNTDAFIQAYANTFPTILVENFWYFVLYDILLAGFLIISIEAFFCGFVLNLLRTRYGFGAVTIQTLLASITLFFFGLTSWEILFLAVLFFGAGAIAYYTRSIYYSLLFTLLLITIFDSIFISIVRSL